MGNLCENYSNNCGSKRTSSATGIEDLRSLKIYDFKQNTRFIYIFQELKDKNNIYKIKFIINYEPVIKKKTVFITIKNKILRDTL